MCSNPNGNFSYDSVCEYTCVEGYELKGSTTTSCTATREWTSRPPTCEREYLSTQGKVHILDTKTPDNTIINIYHSCLPCCLAVRCPVLETPSNSVSACTDFSSFSYGSKCNFNCEEGYRLQGTSEISCTKTGEWSHKSPRCEGRQIFHTYK